MCYEILFCAGVPEENIRKVMVDQANGPSSPPLFFTQWSKPKRYQEVYQWSQISRSPPTIATQIQSITVPEILLHL